MAVVVKDSEHGELWVEALASNIRKIELRLDSVRYENAQKISRSHDKTAAEAIDNVVNGEITSVEIIVDGVKVSIEYPERWLRVYKKALEAFKARYGAEAMTTIKERFYKGRDCIAVYARQGISKRSYQDRRSKFLAMLLLYAVQNNLVALE